MSVITKLGDDVAPAKLFDSRNISPLVIYRCRASAIAHEIYHRATTEAESLC